MSRDLEDAKMKLLGFKPKVKPPPPIVVVPPKEKGTHSLVYEGHLVHFIGNYFYRDRLKGFDQVSSMLQASSGRTGKH